MLGPFYSIALVILSLIFGPLACSASSAQTLNHELDAGTDTLNDVFEDTNLDATEESDTASMDVGSDTEMDAPDLDAVSGGGELLQRSYVGPEGTRDYWLYIPTGYDGSPLPLVVALHGCSQPATHFAYVTGYNQLADSKKFLVIWPEQNFVSNTSLCWNWFLPGHQGRKSGEAAILAAMVREVEGTHQVDPKRIHAVGISAGAAMAVVLGAVFPDVFASIGSVEGCPFNGTPCVGSPSLLPPSTLAQYVVDAMGAHARPVPLFVVQGGLDFNVPPQNAEILVQQWLIAADKIDDGILNGSIGTSPHFTDKGKAPDGHSYETDGYVDSEGSVFLERWLLGGLGHAWPGGAPAIAYSDPKGPSATEESYRFFEAHPMP